MSAKRSAVGWMARAFNAVTGIPARQETLLQVQIETYLRLLLDARTGRADPRSFCFFERKVFSQDGSDGILWEIFRRIGQTNRWFAEIGTQDGMECNTTHLLLRGWKGAWIDADRAATERAARLFAEPAARGDLTVVREEVTPANVESLLARVGAPEEPDLLSIDIDGEDYWVWKAVAHYRPRVVEIEYNAVIPPDLPWVMAPGLGCNQGRDSHFGAGLKSLELLGREKGYRLVACSLAGINAYFVRADCMPPESFCGPHTAEALHEPPRYFLGKLAAGHRRAFGSHVIV